MAKIKLNDSFAEEVDVFRSAGATLEPISVSGISAEDVSLPTVKAYQDRLYDIWGVMRKFYLLTKKDAADMDKLAATLKAADTAGS